MGEGRETPPSRYGEVSIGCPSRWLTDTSGPPNSTPHADPLPSRSGSHASQALGRGFESRRSLQTLAHKKAARGDIATGR
jgi:hypothetical protein